MDRLGSTEIPRSGGNTDQEALCVVDADSCNAFRSLCLIGSFPVPPRTAQVTVSSSFLHSAQSSMKTFALASVLALLAGAASVTDAAPVTVHVHQKHHHAEETTEQLKSVEVSAHHGGRHRHHKHQFKETPWETEPEVKKAKCDDFCMLAGFWQHQLGRNCVSRPTDLCMNYKLATIGLEAVIAVAECDCTTGSSSDDGLSGSNSTAPSHR